MLDASKVARRAAALSGAGAAGGAVGLLPAASRFSLRVKGVPVPPSSPRGNGERSSAAQRRPGEGLASATAPHPVASRLDLSPLAGRGEGGALPLDIAINACTRLGERIFARLGPDEWLVVGPEPDTDAIAAEIEAALAGRSFALVDVSHRNVAFEVAGPDAAAILNAGCPLDLHPRAFPPGAATRTLLGKAEIVLMRAGEEPVFRVECWRSFATYVHGFLTQAAKDV